MAYKRNFKMRNFVIGERIVNDNSKPLVIAEIGINHEGDFKKAVRMVVDAYFSGAECVKFQYHLPDLEMSGDAKKTIPMNTDKSIYDVIASCTLEYEEHARLKKLVESLGMIYLSTPFSREAMDNLLSLGIKLVKVGSGECNNRPLIDYIAKHKIPMIVSTGMNDIKSIRKTVEVIEKYDTPYCLMHCTSLYPTPYSHVRLGGIKELKDAFPNAVIGLSDHSIGNYTSFASIPLGARIIEKHFTSSKEWPGPDIEISLDPEELKDLVYGSAAIFESLGGKKDVLLEEKPTIDFAYASVVSTRKIEKGEALTEENIWVKRPGTGDFLADDYNSLLGKIAKKEIKKDRQIEKNDI